jgi:carboxymethylenebutenolidase
MKKDTKKVISQDVYDLYDSYAHNQIDRRVFMERLSTYAVGGLTLPALLDYIMPDYEKKVQITQDDPRLITSEIEYQSSKGGGAIKGQLSRPKDQTSKLPGILIVHENRGLNPHIADVGRRAALAGFVSLAPDALTPLGGYPGNDDDGRTLQRKRDRNEMLEDFIAGYYALKDFPDCTGTVGVVGFCFGGWVSNMLAVRIPELGAAVPFYGGQPSDEETAKIQSPLMLHFAELDQRVNAGWPEYEKALKKYEKEYTAYMYPDVNHGFHNDTTPRYNEEAAKLAWTRTIDFFKKNLG